MSRPSAAAATLARLTAGWTLKPLEIEHLELVPAGATAQAGIEPRAFLEAIATLSFHEKFALVDLAIQARAPALSAEQPD